MILRLVLLGFILVHTLSLTSIATSTGGYKWKWKGQKQGASGWRSWYSCSGTSPDACKGLPDKVPDVPQSHASESADSQSTTVPSISGNIIAPTHTPYDPLLMGTTLEASGADNSATAALTTTASSPSSPANVGGEVQVWLDSHNSVRQQHGASALSWSEELASFAQSRAGGCDFSHSGGPYGENLYNGGGDSSPEDVVSLWAEEVSDYDPSNPTYSHFTQLVWKSTTGLGCSIAACGGSSLAVCEYEPPGNMNTKEQYAENVQV